jgi:hypothetical protein
MNYRRGDRLGPESVREISCAAGTGVELRLRTEVFGADFGGVFSAGAAETVGVERFLTQSRKEPAALTALASSRTAAAMASRSRGCAGRENQ